ncbi:MAG: hypothetical protein ACKV2T_07345 [Kofleriaceae bacterium]
MVRWAFVVAALGACATASPDEPGPDASVGIEEITPAGDPTYASITLSQTASQEIAPQRSVACGNRDGSTAENSWYRVFRLADANIGSGLVVNSVVIGVQEAWGSPEIEIRLATYAGDISPWPEALDPGLITPLSSTPYKIPDTFSTAPRLITIPMRANVPALSQLVFEIYAPTFEGNYRYFYLGGNDAGESAPSYLRAPSSLCNAPAPRTTSNLGFPESNLVFAVNGTYSPR